MSDTQNYYQRKLGLRLCCELAETEEDIKTGRVALKQESFEDICSRLFGMKNEM